MTQPTMVDLPGAMRAPAATLAAAAAACIALAAPESGGLADAIAMLESLEARRATIDLRDVPLDRAITTIEDAAGVSIRADWESLRSLGVDRDDRVTLRLDDAPLHGVLQAITLSIGREYERPVFDVGAGQVVITTTAGAAALRFTDLYDVRALLVDATAQRTVAREVAERDDAREAAAAPADTVTPAADDPPPRHVAIDDADAPGAADQPSTPAPPPTPAARLGELLMQHVDPESWLLTSAGGARIDDHDGVLMVTAPPRVHRRLRALVDRLRALHPTAVEVEAAIVRIDRDMLAMLRRRHRPEGAALARAVAGAAEAVVLWRTASVARLGETATVRTQAGAADGRPERVDLSVTPSLDATTSTLSLAIDLLVEGAGHTRRATTTAAAPLRDGGVLVEFADASEGEAVVLAIVPTAR